MRESARLELAVAAALSERLGLTLNELRTRQIR